ncbi:MAG: SDR family NAD(P)-dependent oxidoreductase [Planctomycetota bacterium]
MAVSQRVVIVGGTGGIGGALAEALVAAGHRPFLVARDADRVSTTAHRLGCDGAACDASDVDALSACVEGAAGRLGGLDGIVNCAGSILLKAAHLTTAAEWQTTLAANLTTAFACVHAAGKVLRQQGGAVVLVSSAAARVGLANHEAIAAAKAGIIGLTLSAAATYARSGIRFNAVAPGLVRTPLSRGVIASEPAEKASIAMHPLGRLGEPGDVARAIAWLLDPAQSWVTGQVIGIDGGLADLRVRTG